jgi:hypothetical protein
VEQALVLDSASDELRAMVRAGEIEAQAAITLVRQHGPHAARAATEVLLQLEADIHGSAANDPVADGTTKARKAKPAKVTVRAMRELKAKQATLPTEHARQVAASLNEFATEIGGDALLAELCELDAVNDDLYTLEV